MAKTVIVVDDIDGSPNAQTVQFSFDGTSYAIDLSKKNRAAFEKALKPWIAASTEVSGGSRARRRKPGGSSSRSSQRAGPDLAAVRAWAVEQGVEVSQRGRIAGSVIDAYNAAH